MRARGLAACAVLVAAAGAGAQPVRPVSVFEAAAPPTELPLLPVPGTPAPQPPYAPRGPVGEYDHGLLYLPERAPEPERREPPCGAPGRFWFTPILHVAQTPALQVGDARLRPDARAGLGLDAGLWLDPGHVAGVQSSFFYLGRGAADDLGMSYAARFASADVNYRQRLLCGEVLRVDGLAGYRYGRVAEDLSPGGLVEVSTKNQFHGGQIGLTGEWRGGGWYVGATGTAAFGRLYADTALVGLRPVGDEARYAVMPAAAVRLGREFGDHARAFVGYEYVGLTRATRPADALAGGTSDFGAQGLSLGLELRY